MEKRIINTEKAPAPVGPYNQAVMTGNLLFVSAQIAIDPVSGRLIVDNIEDETRQVLKNIGEVLKAAEMGFENVIKASVFVSNMDNYSRINAVYADFFEDIKAPARELVEVARLPKDVNVEISVIATV